MAKKNVIISTLTIISISVALFFQNSNTYKLPTEESAFSYQQATENNIERLANILQPIRSRQQADEAIYAIAPIISLNKAALDSLSYENLESNIAIARLQHFIQIDNARLSNRKYADFLNEVNRLENVQYYNSYALKYIIHAFLVEANTNNHVPLWLLSARIRIVLYGNAKVNSLASISEQAIPDSFLAKAINLKTNFSPDSIPLLALDALQCSGERADEDVAVTLITPPYHSLRGENSFFLNCFCPRYCIRDPLHSHGSFEAKTKLENSTLADIVNLSKNSALNSPVLLDVKNTQYDSRIILRLGTPFKSRYLITQYANEEQYPNSFIFASDINESEDNDITQQNYSLEGTL